jgi:hypothetical protein
MSQPKMQNMAGFAGGVPGHAQQNNSDVHTGQIWGFVMQALQQQPPGVAWRAQVGVQERVHWIKQMYVSNYGGYW